MKVHQNLRKSSARKNPKDKRVARLRQFLVGESYGKSWNEHHGSTSRHKQGQQVHSFIYDSFTKWTEAYAKSGSWDNSYCIREWFHQSIRYSPPDPFCRAQQWLHQTVQLHFNCNANANILWKGTEPRRWIPSPGFDSIQFLKAKLYTFFTNHDGSWEKHHHAVWSWRSWLHL